MCGEPFPHAFLYLNESLRVKTKLDHGVRRARRAHGRRPQGHEDPLRHGVSETHLAEFRRLW